MKAIKNFLVAVVEVIQESRKLQAKNYTFSQKSDLENYIISKKPQSAADVDHWTKKYYESQYRGL